MASVRVGRANAAVLSRVTVDYYGTPTPISSVANVNVSDARTLTITPWDASLNKPIEKAILASDVGITPSNDGKVIRLLFPQLTEERRKELKKQIAKMGEDAKVALRNIRREANDSSIALLSWNSRTSSSSFTSSAVRYYSCSSTRVTGTAPLFSMICGILSRTSLSKRFIESLLFSHYKSSEVKMQAKPGESLPVHSIIASYFLPAALVLYRKFR